MKRVIALVAALQFIYILDFIMVLPLGPDLAAALGFPADRLGALTAAYTVASVLSGLALMRVLDRFDRRHVLLCAFGLMALATLATTLATDLPTLLAARALTGFLGAPVIATGMALVIDITPPAQRGRAMARVMIGFSGAVVAGVPLALEVARLGGWQAPFFSLAALALGVWLCAAWLLPPSRRAGAPGATMRVLLRQPLVRNACLVQALSQFSAFLLIPHFSAWFLLNLGFPRDRLGLLYVTGGLTALAVVQLLGRLVDRTGPRLAVALASAGMACGLSAFFTDSGPLAVVAFVLFMAGNAGRNVSLGAAISHVPSPQERAGFMALQSMVQDVAIAAAALVSGLLLAQTADGKLVGMQVLAGCAAVVGCAVLWALWRLSHQQALYSRTTS